ncbi:MAG: ABC-2 transporter permease [Clostridia bacterium]|nr:ABC-2 transporter permease [Clostridia bacterium]
MKGLIKYDLMQIYSGVKGGFILLYLIVMAFLSVINNSGHAFSYMMVFIFTLFGISAFSYEESFHWDRYTAALPVSNRQIVLARYGMVGICIAAGMVVGFLLGLISMISGTMDIALSDWGLSLIQCLAITLLYMEIMMPIMYRFGTEHGRIIMLMLFIVFFSIVCVLGAFAYVWEHMITVYSLTLALAIIAIVLFPVSVIASVRIRAKKEF